MKINERGNENNEKCCKILSEFLGLKIMPKNNGIVKINLKQTNVKVDSQQIENEIEEIN